MMASTFSATLAFPNTSRSCKPSPPLTLNKKGEYLFALSIVMPGEWEVQLTFAKDAKVLYRGSTKFNV